MLPPELRAGRPDESPSAGSGGRTVSGLAVAALIPALNEETTLPGAIAGLRRAGLDRIVVVDNGSTDDTARVARTAGAEVVAEPSRGYGAACLAGMAYLEREDPPDILVFMDGDQSDDPSAVADLVEPIHAQRAEFVIGVRRAPGNGRGSAVPLHARLGNALILAGARILHGTRFRDLGPFRAIRFDVLRALEMDDRNWGWTLQMQLRAHHRGIRTEEVVVPHRERAGGRSKVSGTLSGSLKAGAKMILTLVREEFVRARLSGGSA